mmetsp:Transcript_876/g.3358  ORF Transcript_876/g.3358 Transcript_876/m.3358 type:complete len:677 (+) Transcript_876:66-2096(+)
MGFGWGRVAPGDAPHKYPPRFTLTVGETLVALVPDNASTSRQDNESFGLVVTRTGPGVLRVEPTPTIETALAAAKACDTRLQTNTVFGLAGAYRTSSGFHLLVVTGCESVGAVKNARVFRVTKIETVCVGAKKALGLDASDLCRSNTSSELRPERKSHKLMKTFLASGNVKRLFFSGDANEFDVTRSFSRMNQSTAMEEHESEPISDTNWRRCDGNFLWNRGVGSVFLEGLDKDGQTKADSLLVPLAFGSWGTEQFDVASLGDKSDETKKTIATARCSLVARVSTKRVGIRHHCRGADLGGNVANFVETEQIVEVGVGGLEVEGDTFARDTNKTDTENTENTETETQKRSYVSSFVILRGSVPTRWAQPLLDLRWKFPLLNMDKADSTATTKHHLAGLRETYGQVAVLDLLKQGKTNKESALAACWRDAIADSGSETSYFPFDLGRQIGFSGDKKALEQMLKVMNKSLTGHGFWFHAKDGATMSDEKVTDQESHKKHYTLDIGWYPGPFVDSTVSSVSRCLMSVFSMTRLSSVTPTSSSALTASAPSDARKAAVTLARVSSVSLQVDSKSAHKTPPSVGTNSDLLITSSHGRRCANLSFKSFRIDSWSSTDVPHRPDRSNTKTTQVGRCSNVAIASFSILFRSSSGRQSSPGVSVTMCRLSSRKKCPIFIPRVVNG